jgi:hypothetical protein
MISLLICIFVIPHCLYKDNDSIKVKSGCHIFAICVGVMPYINIVLAVFTVVYCFIDIIDKTLRGEYFDVDK